MMSMKFENAEVIVRKALIEDILLLSEMLADLFSIEDDFEIDLQKHKKALEMIISGKTGGMIFIAEKNMMAVGMVNLQKTVSTAAGGYSVLLEDLYVIPACRNSGIGKILIDKAVQWGREQNAFRIQLAADLRNLQAADFYSGRGFKKSNMICYYKFI